MSTTSKQDFIRTFLPSKINNINFAQIDMDISDLSLADIMRNVNKTFPKNTRIRNAIASGTHAVGILCKTELLEPLSGLLLIITGDDTVIELVSRNYIVISVQEDLITDDESIKHVIDGITKYIITSFKDSIVKFNDFYVKYIYDEYEMELDSNEDYATVYDKYL